MSSNSVTTSGFSQLKSGCSGANRWRYHSPSGSRVQAGPPKADSQSVGASSPCSPRPGRNTYRSRSGLPGPAARAAWNQRCWSEEWFGTMSMMTRRPSPCASAIMASASARLPKSGSMSR